MTSTAIAPPTVALAADLGTSASKFFYRTGASQLKPLWMGAEVAAGLTVAALPSINTGGRPQDQAWLQMADEVVLVGDNAKSVLDANSLRANKAALAVYKLVAALGVVAELDRLPSCYAATLWMPLPLTEIRTRDEIATKLSAICDRGFVFRGKPQQVKVLLKCFPEGFGLYLNRKKQLAAMGQAIEQQRTLILMMGHRNLSLLCFEGGSLKTASSNSDGPGFWSAFEKTARSLGIPPADYPSLLAALTTGRTQQISQARAGLLDFGAIAQAVQQTYWKSISVYLQDNLLGQLTEGNVDLVISGGASVVLRPLLRDYFEQLGLSAHLSFADGTPERLPELVKGMPEFATQPALALRMADCFGLFQGLIGKSNKVIAS